MNVCGRRIWADKPRFFCDMKWLANRATVEKFIAWTEIMRKQAELMKGEESENVPF